MNDEIDQKFLDLYLRKSGDKDIADNNLITDPEHGFMSYMVTEDKLLALSVCGNGKFWDKMLERIAQHEGLKRIEFFTHRNPRAFSRRFGYKVSGYVMSKEV